MWPLRQASGQEPGGPDEVPAAGPGERNQQSQLASRLNSWASELGSMASRSEDSGPMTDLAQEASRRVGEMSHWLDTHEPADLLEEVKRFARRRPVAFLALAAAAGVVAGRVTSGRRGREYQAGLRHRPVPRACLRQRRSRRLRRRPEKAVARTASALPRAAATTRAMARWRVRPATSAAACRPGPGEVR